MKKIQLAVAGDAVRFPILWDRERQLRLSCSSLRLEQLHERGKTALAGALREGQLVDERRTTPGSTALR
jgi:hypothetical protein